MIQQLSKVKKELKNQIDLISQSNVNLMNKIILTRSLVENFAIFNFLKDNNTYHRIELFQVFGDFEWYSHQLYYSHPKAKRISRFRKFLITTQKRYPDAYQKYGRLIKRRLCKQLRTLIKCQPQNATHWQKKLDLINSNRPDLHNRQITLLATFMSHHLITKLPFPYRIVFGKSITYFVLKYSQINRNTYWLLSDLAHGTLIENHLNHQDLIKIIQKIITIINSSL